jgi:hypothetical protein
MAPEPLVRIPFTLAEMGELPQRMRYEFWDGTADSPSEPARVNFHVPPPVTDADIVTQPLPQMKALEVLRPLWLIVPRKEDSSYRRIRIGGLGHRGKPHNF